MSGLILQINMKIYLVVPNDRMLRRKGIFLGMDSDEMHYEIFLTHLRKYIPVPIELLLCNMDEIPNDAVFIIAYAYNNIFKDLKNNPHYSNKTFIRKIFWIEAAFMYPKDVTSPNDFEEHSFAGITFVRNYRTYLTGDSTSLTPAYFADFYALDLLEKNNKI